MTKAMNRDFLRAGLCIQLFLLLAGQGWAGTFQLSYKFATGASFPNTYLYGNASVGSDHLALTEAAQDQKGTFIIDALPPNQRVDSFSVEFQAQLQRGASSYNADGISFNFGPELLQAAVGEDGITNGLSVTFDTYDNGGSDSAPAVEVVYNGQVLAGATFSGRTRTNVWPIAIGTNGLAAVFETGSASKDVKVSLTPGPSGGASVVSVSWDGVMILTNIAVPYTPQKGWRMAFGGRTGNSCQAQYLRNIEISGTTFVLLNVVSDYGQTLIDPPAGIHHEPVGEPIVFTVPEYVYLDRYKRELAPTPINVNSLAYYRAHRLGSDIAAGAGPQSGSTLFLDADTTVTWHWAIENLAEIHTGTEGIVGVSDSDVTDAAHVPALGRHFHSVTESEFDSVVYNSIRGGVQPIRFSARGYVIENAPNSPERYLELAGEGDHLRADASGVDTILTNTSFSVDFWARLNTLAATNDQTVVNVGSQVTSGKQLRLGFGIDKGFFVDNNQTRAAAPGGWTDTSWHHWAMVNNAAADTVQLYRDGKVILSKSPALASYAGDGSVTIGAHSSGTNSDCFFSGGLNNLRIWNSALTQSNVIESLGTVQYTNSRPDLVLEMPFDQTPSVGGVGVFARQFKAPSGSNAVAVLNPVGYWRLNESGGPLVANAGFAGAALNGFQSNSPALGQPGPRPYDFSGFEQSNTAVGFNGVNQNIVVPYSPALNPSNFTVSCWAYLTGGGGTYRSPLTSRDVSGTDAYGYIFYASNTDQWQFWGGSRTGWQVFSGTPVQTNVWTHLIGTYDGIAYRFYINGLPVGVPVTNTFRPNPQRPLCIGAGATEIATNLFFFPGRVDEVFVLDRAISPLEAQGLCGAANPSVTNLSIYASLDDQYLTNSFSLPDPFPASGANGSNYFYGYHFHSLLRVDAGGNYTFHLNSDDGSQLFIDGQLVINNDGVHAPATVDGQVVLSQGQHLVVVKYFDAGGGHALSLEYECAAAGVARQSIPLANLTITAQDLLQHDQITTASTEGRAVSFHFRDFESLFPAGTTASNMVAAVQPGFDFVRVRDAGVSTVNIALIGKAPLTDWRRVLWGWDKQFEIKISVSAPDDAGVAAVSRHPFFAGDATGVNVNGLSSAKSASLGAGVVDVLDEWIDEGERLTLGAVYRTLDRKYTLSGISGNLNSFGVISLDKLVDGVYSLPGLGQAVTRQYTFPAVSGPGSLILQYSKTIHRAILPIGVGLDVSSLSAVNSQLYPELPVGSSDLQITVEGPSASDMTTALSGTLSGGSGKGWIWDFVGRKWYPTKPGKYSITWADQTGYTNTLEVTANFPHENQLSSGFLGWEGKDGARLGDSSLNYLHTNTLDDVDAIYPGAPYVHYSYALSPGANAYRADLDPLSNDDWLFYDFAFSENNTAQVANNRIFTDTRAGNRSVLVYSHRLNPAEKATGDLTKESIVIRLLGAPPAGDSKHPDPYFTNRASAVVGQKLTSPYDQAGFTSGQVTNNSVNFNPDIYNAGADIGQWGPIYPVNAYNASCSSMPLSVTWYYKTSGGGNDHHTEPLSYLPQCTTIYTNISYPDPATADVIYISSQMGSEGVGQAISTNGPNYQLLFDPALYSGLKIYNQPDPARSGYNPNEEHAFVAPSKAFNITGDASFNRGQSAVFALQNGLNITNASGYTSDPFVLAQYQVLGNTNINDAYVMRAYVVKTVRKNESSVPFPNLDSGTHTVMDANGVAVTQPANPTYDFRYPAFAGDIVVAPYPLNLVIGSVVQTNTLGGNLIFTNEFNTQVAQRSLWRDKNSNAWIVSGGGRFFQRYWYPLRDDFWLGSAARPAIGTPVAWVPPGVAPGQVQSFTGATTLAVASKYDAYWRKDYPVLKRGETLTYPGGEYKADRPSSPGLPGVLGWASAEVVYDTETPSMILVQSTNSSARVTRPLDRYAVSIKQEQIPADLHPAHPDKVMVVGSRWYFKGLTGSLSKRFYYDSLAGELVFRGRLNNLESGAPNLTQTPIQPYLLEPNFMNDEDAETLKGLPSSESEEWTMAIGHLKDAASSQFTTRTDTGLGVVSVTNQTAIRFYLDTGTNVDSVPQSIGGFTNGVGSLVPASSFGIGSALVPSPLLLDKASNEPLYLALAENNDPRASGAVALHILQIGEERYRGTIQVVTPQNAFDEKVTLNHTADFGGNTAEVYYQWWVHDVTPLDQIGTPDATNAPNASGWQIYKQGLGLNSIDFTGRPDITLADKFFYVRYGNQEELKAANPINLVTTNGSVDNSSWRLVSPDDSAPDWKPEENAPAPYQWAGAANSPQAQADGSHRFLPQLVMGWVKRILDQINPYEARFSATFSGDSPATYSSMLQEAGRPYIGPVALNAEKDAIENVGLIELYETVLQRAKDLTQGNNSTAGTDQALLLAATRLAELYDLLGSEAYSDAQNSAIPLTDEQGNPVDPSLAGNSSVFAFQNEVPTLLQEELSLLRGTDFLKAYPTYNRLFWNYLKGPGEAAYNINYHIQDANLDGVINESDAAIQYPMGHGDAWGHYLSALKMHYELLRRPGFQWQARSELYSLLGNVLPTDYLDEKSFATTAAARARTGLEILKSTYKDAYVSDPAGQWQGYTDSANPARAWGVSEWSQRAGQGAYFDWLVGNALVPTQSTNPVTGQLAQGLDKIDRTANTADLGEISGVLLEIQNTLDGVNQGRNPLGLDPDALTFDVEPYYDGVWWEHFTPFEQVYDRAVMAANNALTAFNYASRADQQLRHITSDTAELQRQALLQDLDYQNQLIGLLGTPYQGAIGSGKIFKEGYSGPDLLTYMYVDETFVSKITPARPSSFNYQTTLDNIRNTGNALDFQEITFQPDTARANVSQTGKNQNQAVFDGFYLNQDSEFGKTILNNPNLTNTPGASDTVLSTALPYEEVSDYAFKAPAEWGRRTSPGEVQVAINQMLSAQIDLEMAVETYNDYVKSLQLLTFNTKQKLNSIQENLKFTRYYEGLRIGFETAKAALEKAASIVEGASKGRPKQTSLNELNNSAPGDVGAFNGVDMFFALRAALQSVELVVNETKEHVALGLDIGASVMDLSAKISEISQDAGNETIASYNEFLASLNELSTELKDEEIKRLDITGPLQRLKMAADHVRAVEASAERLQAQRTAKNMQIAASAQRNRYSDMVTRLGRNEALRKYDNALDNALRYAWLAAKMYDYETSLSDGHPAAAATLLDQIAKTRQLGLWVDGQPQVGNGGLADSLAKLKANYQSLKGQIGLNQNQFETSRFSLRSELLRIPAGADGDAAWQAVLTASKVADLGAVPEFRQYCRPFADPSSGPQSGLVLEFGTQINPGVNFFGHPLSGGDHSYSVANFATKIRSHAIAFPGYDGIGTGASPQLAVTPRYYLVPAGIDQQRCSDSLNLQTRSWNVVSQRIPIPYVINSSNLKDPGYSPSVQGLDGSFVDRIRFGDSRAFITDNGLAVDQEMFSSPNTPGWNVSSRLYGRSAWNTRWLLIIPGANLSANSEAGLQRFIQTVTDIRLQLETYSNQGM